MAVKVGINGFGRIGRQVFKVIWDEYEDELEVVAVNDIVDARTLAHLLQYDTTYGPFYEEVEAGDGVIHVGDREVKALSVRNPAELPWKELGVEIVIEATGVFRDGEKAKAHLEAGARKVIITAPAKNEDLTVVLGVNEDAYDPEKHHILSNASCTTNCLAPVAKVLDERFGIVRGFMTTIHAYTADQRLQDAPHRDLRRARAAAANLVPTTTGAARAVGLVLPQLQGKFDGMAIRVPTLTVSLIDFVVQVEKATTVEEVNAAFQEASEEELEGILAYTEEPLVSSDFVGISYSAIVDGLSTNVIDGTLVKVLAWYDNEWGYATRVADLAALIAEQL